MSAGLQDVAVSCPQCGRPAWLRVEWPGPDLPPRVHGYECRGGCTLPADRAASLLPPWLPART